MVPPSEACRHAAMGTATPGAPAPSSGIMGRRVSRGKATRSGRFLSNNLTANTRMLGRVVRHAGPAGAFKHKGTVSVWKNAFTI